MPIVMVGQRGSLKVTPTQHHNVNVKLAPNNEDEIVVQRRGQVSVKLNQNDSGLLQPSGQPIALTPLLQHAHLSELLDVEITGTPSNGYAVIYNSETNKYDVRPIEVADIALDLIDGGTF
jgi:hypothetical protein